MRSAEDGLGPHGQIAGLVPVDGVVAEPDLRDREVPGEGELDLAIVGRGPDVQSPSGMSRLRPSKRACRTAPPFGRSFTIASPISPSL